MKRIEVADGLRGFCLLGIFMANLLIFQFGLSGHSFIEYFHLDTANQSVFNLILIVFEGSFMPIFAILFGFSMDKLYQSMKWRQMKRPKLKLLRRAFFLIVLGLLHGLFIWEGDILTTYGLAMLMIIPFISLNKKYFKWFTIIGFSIIVLIFSLSIFGQAESSISAQDKINYIHDIKEIFGNGSYADIRNVENLTENPKFEDLEQQLGNGKGVGLFFIGAILLQIPIFTLGICLSRYKWFEKTAKSFWSSKLFIYLIPISLVLKSSILWLDNEGVSGSLNNIFGILLAFGYICLFKYLYQKYTTFKIFRGLENMGKMSLTMYIMQSIIGTLVLYSYGLGLFGKNILIYTSLGFIGIYVIQIFLASWYQKYFRYGPLEYILRMFTYWKVKVKAKGQS
ncbi:MULTISPECIES: DUF418 domain-containing protein [Staphylococcus]|uniref:DUF418 domain-containing protein n=1 Tax=Staphylococcus hsinchuensis TaxID=3051183 RepID=A0ABZ3EEX0_9STAP|nr:MULTISPECIES: DUF418 domain-containing protein [unclassified Staphylococcus]